MGLGFLGLRGRWLGVRGYRWMSDDVNEKIWDCQACQTYWLIIDQCLLNSTDISWFFFEAGPSSPRNPMNLQLLLSQNVDHHLRILQTIIPIFIVVPFLTLEHSLPQIALNLSAAPLMSSKQIDGMIDCLGRCCDIRAGVGVVSDGTDCVVLAVSMLFQWFDVAELLSLFEAGKGLDQILESYFVILRDYLAIVLEAGLPFRRNVTISPYFRTYNLLTPAILSP